MKDREVILNLRYVCGEKGTSYSLRVKAYVAEGAEEEKLAFLQDRARLDYLISEPFEIPERFHVNIGLGREARKMPVGHIAMLKTLGSPIAIFEDAIKTIEDRFPAQSGVSISQDPLVCTTALMQNAEGVIEPRINGQIRF
jgi:hypothetical protein